MIKLFGDIKAKKKFLETDVIWDNKIDRLLYVDEFFGNNQLKNEKVLDVSNIINMNVVNYEEDDDLILNDFIENNRGLEKRRKILDDEVMKMRNYHEEKYAL